VYASSQWIVKPGHEDEFARIWQSTADQASLEFPAVTFRLLRDAGNPRRFIAFTGPWRNAEQLSTARSAAPFRELVAASEPIIESSELSAFELVVEIS
jgi:quinol monooxygenase YgiN